MDFIDKTVSDVEPVKPPPVERTSFKLVQDVKDLKELAAKLRDASEFAVIFYIMFLLTDLVNAVKAWILCWIFFVMEYFYQLSSSCI